MMFLHILSTLENTRTVDHVDRGYSFISCCIGRLEWCTAYLKKKMKLKKLPVNLEYPV